MLKKLNDYNELEFILVLKKIYSDDRDDAFLEDVVYYFNSEITHPEGSALLTHPTMVGIEDSPEAVVAELKRWYAEQGLPCFKPE
ncbi:bacteriocin immunity protein [Photobacterium sp. 1_MG-2023]|uniref:bacteriocin immunity protein n=1 Tax=Photobacterium sp. 1_MG-2023 TaxID=3062646 RepID=UPI0026E1BA9C|nr:bacteriocin immunity protein [Photobacterium sp. 1_MG-2023]MDO6708619.1 bacteriocin immunity protein [Photobacterium sp. 1_MG-2023]